ncbi:MAG TPA: exonuclease domain-containing protein [Anaerolineales bacterium]|jgi:DNA polymerase III epsilon subunit family exonuclease
MTFDLSNARFAFLDLETTGLLPWFGDRICEVGIVITEGKRIKNTYQQLVNPERALSPAAASTNGLKDSDLSEAPTFQLLAREVLAQLNDSIVVCHNAQFDLQFLDSEYRRIGHEIQISNLIDTLFVARDNFNFPSYSLTNVAAEFNIQNPDAHRALADALTDKAVFFAMMDALKKTGKQFDEFIGLYNSPAWPRDGVGLPTEIGEAIYSGKRLLITYIDKDGEQTERWVTPLQVLGLSDYIYLRGYCHLRGGERTFRLDRIVRVRVEAENK